ncbi:MAG TPA: response regulator [Cellvibrionaceae bacterium]
MNNTTGKPVLLFIDDETRILRTMEMAFKRDYKVLTTTDGREALEMLTQHEVDVIISDQRMPLITGVEVLREARRIAPAAVRILLTGYAELASIVGSINDGEIFRYVQKPWHLNELRETLDEAVQIAKTTREAALQAHHTAEPASGHIVVLHKNRAMAQLISKEKPDYRVDYAATIEQALTFLHHYPNAILLTDIILPEGDISDALALLKRKRPELVVLVVTAFTDTSHLIRLINRAQVFRVLPMPLSRRMLYNGIHAALCHQRTLQHTPIMLRRHRVAKNTEENEKNATILGRVRGYLGSR